MNVKRLSAADYTNVPWKNGGGVSTTIAGECMPGAAAGDWGGVVWQLGRTAIVTPAPFSDLSGFERLQTVTRGRGLFLDMPDGVIDLSAPLTVARYDGGAPIVSRLSDGPVEVVNLMARRDMARIGMEVLRAGAAAKLVSGVHIVLACAGPCEVRLGDADHVLADGEALMVESGPVSLTVTDGLALVASVLRL